MIRMAVRLLIIHAMLKLLRWTDRNSRRRLYQHLKRKIWIIEISIALWSCKNKNKIPGSLFNEIEAFAGKDHYQGALSHVGARLCLYTPYGPVPHLQIGEIKGAHSTYNERPAAVMISLWNGYLLCCRVSCFVKSRYENQGLSSGMGG